jgi:cytidyltransferase-like protein
MKKVIMVSGGFDPPHIGHTRMFTEAAEWGVVVVALNSDEWLIRKKGYSFMTWEERAELIQQFESVDSVVPFNDSDDTACDALTTIKPDAFANGGDRKKDNTPEMQICDSMNIQMLWNIGGKEKPQSSSWLVENARRKEQENERK